MIGEFGDFVNLNEKGGFFEKSQVRAEERGGAEDFSQETR